MMTSDSSKPQTESRVITILRPLYMDFCQHVTPSLAGYLFAKYPFLGNDYSFELVVGAQALLPMMITHLTPDYVVNSIIDGIVWLRVSGKKIWAAIWKPQA